MPVTRLVAAIGILAVWVTLTVVGGLVYSAGRTSFLEIVTGGLAWPFAVAATFLLAIIGLTRWPGTGLGPPAPARALLVLWLPLLYIAGFLTVAVVLGLPPAAVTGLILFNCLLVGLSEELMFRGILLQATRAALPFWPAVIGSTLVFGAVHSLNVFLTGELSLALVQSVAAFLSGLVFVAIRLCTGSLWPGVVLHGLWNAGTFLMLAAGDGAMLREAATETTPATYVLPVLLVLPNGLYALWLLRRWRRRNP